MIYRLRVDGERLVPLFVSDHISALLGFQPSETLYAEWWLEHVHPEDRARAFGSSGEALDQGTSRLEYRIRDRAGVYRWVDDHKCLVRDASGRPQELIGIWTDATERKVAEGEAAERFRLISLAAEVGSSLTRGLPLHEMLQGCAEALVEHLQAAFARIWTVNEPSNELELRASAGMYTHLNGSHGRVPIGQLKIGLIAKERKPHLTNQVIGDPRVGDQEWAKREGMVSFAGYPLVVADKVVGVVALFARHCLPHSTLQALEGVADGIALGIERMSAEEALNNSQARMRLQTAALEAAANGVMITDPAGAILWVNPAFTQLTGYSADEVLGKNPRLLKSGLNPDSLYKDLWQTIRGGRPWKGELINRQKSGSMYHEDMTVTPVRAANGDITHFIAIKQDITVRKRREEELRWKTALLEAQLDSAPDGILVVDEHKRHLLRNERVNALWKIPPDLAEDLNDAQAVRFVAGQTTNPPGFLARVEHLYAHPDEVGRDEIELRNGTILDRYTSPVRDRGGKYYGRIWTFRDITEGKKAEASMQALHRQLVDASREAGMAEVATSVLHNVGNVLNSVNVSVNFIEERIRKSRSSDLRRLSDLLLRHAGDLAGFLTSEPRGRRVPEFINQLATQLAQEQSLLLAELTSLQKNVGHIKEIVAMQQAHAKVSGLIEAVDLHQLIEDVLRMNASAFSRRDVKVVREYNSGPTISTDKHKVMQILLNLVRNATYACDDQGGPNKTVRLRVSEREQEVLIEVTDNGIGIPPENLALIFTHGFTTRKDGHGFGLHSGALAAKELGGRLEAKSAGLRQGSSFTLVLPKQPGCSEPSLLRPKLLRQTLSTELELTV